MEAGEDRSGERRARRTSWPFGGCSGSVGRGKQREAVQRANEAGAKEW